MHYQDKVFSMYDAALAVLDAWEQGDAPKDVAGGHDFLRGQIEVVARMLVWSNGVPSIPSKEFGEIVSALRYETVHYLDEVLGRGAVETVAAELARAWVRAVFDPACRIHIDRRGVVILPSNHPRATVCGVCGRGWDDSISTSVTPTPSGRCPFEDEHEGEP